MIKKKDSLIKSYKIIEAFVQCDYLDGFKYIDKAGEIINLFTRKNKEVPKFTMGLPGLKISDLSNEIKELKISSQTIWIHFVEPKNLGDIEKEAVKIIEDITKVIKPSMYSRIGWRTYFAREFTKNTSEPALNLKATKSISNYKFETIVVTKNVDDYNLRLEVSPIVKADKPGNGALLFDVDFAKNDENFGIVPNSDLKIMRQKLRSDEIFETFEGLLV